MPSFDEYDRVRPTDTDPTSTSDDESAGGSTSPRRRPSGSPSELIQQLLRELARVRNTDLNEEERSDAFHLVRAYLAHAQALAWKDVVQGTDLLGPRRVLIALQRVRPFVDRHYPDLEPAGQIAIEIETVMAGLLAAEDTLERIRAERRMKDPDLSALEQAVLRVLSRQASSQRRGQVYEKLEPEVKRSPQWVGKVLQKLSDDGYLYSTQGRAQGNPETAFYAIARKGLELCREIDLVRNVEGRRVGEVLKSAVDFRYLHAVRGNSQRDLEAATYAAASEDRELGRVASPPRESQEEIALRRSINQRAVTLSKTGVTPVERGLAEAVLGAEAEQYGLGDLRPDGSFEYKPDEVFEPADV